MYTFTNIIIIIHLLHKCQYEMVLMKSNKSLGFRLSWHSHMPCFVNTNSFSIMYSTIMYYCRQPSRIREAKNYHKNVLGVDVCKWQLFRKVVWFGWKNCSQLHPQPQYNHRRYNTIICRFHHKYSYKYCIIAKVATALVVLKLSQLPKV